jgi:hypothetical protein
VIFDGAEYTLGDEARRSQLDDRLREFFGPHASVQQLIDACTVDDVRLEALRLSRHAPHLFETRAAFANPDHSVSGTFVNVWQRGDRGRLVRTREGRLFISGSRARLALQLHANLVEFARRTQCVDRVEVEAREVGRYAYRFMHGVEVDAATRAEIGRRLVETRPLLGVELDSDLFATLRSPREIVDFLVLPRIREPWMETVDEIVQSQGFRFTVDQVVDVARRPGLAFLLEQPAYCMSLQVTDDRAHQRFLESVRLGRQRESLQRLRGVLGNPFSQLPKRVRSALLTYRPYLFPSPRETPKIPDLEYLVPPEPPVRVIGFRASDDALVRSIAADPPDARVRDYRAPEVERAAHAVLNGARLVSITGLSGTGKTEIVIWNLETALAAQGHQVVSLDAQQLIKRDDAAALLREIDDVVRPTVVISTSPSTSGDRGGASSWSSPSAFSAGPIATSSSSGAGGSLPRLSAWPSSASSVRSGSGSRPPRYRCSPSPSTCARRSGSWASAGSTGPTKNRSELCFTTPSSGFPPTSSRWCRCGSTSTPRSKAWIRPGP